MLPKSKSSSNSSAEARRRTYFGWFLIHFFLILSVSLRDVLWTIGSGYTSLPQWLEPYARRAEDISRLSLGQTAGTPGLFRQIVGTYLHAAGIDKGYGYFAPGVPNSHKLVFELHFSDGRVEYELPRVNTPASGMRMSALIDAISEPDYEPLQEVIFKMLAYSTWREHPDAVTIRTVFGEIEEPTAAEALHGKRELYHFLSAYEYRFIPQRDDPSQR